MEPTTAVYLEVGNALDQEIADLILHYNGLGYPLDAILGKFQQKMFLTMTTALEQYKTERLGLTK